MQKQKSRERSKIIPGTLVKRKELDRKHPTQVAMFLRETQDQIKLADATSADFFDVLYRGRIVCWHVSNLELVDDML